VTVTVDTGAPPPPNRAPAPEWYTLLQNKISNRLRGTWPAKFLAVIILFGFFYWRFPIAGWWILSKVLGLIYGTAAVTKDVVSGAASGVAAAAEAAKNAAEAELARRLIVKEALASLTPCDSLRCPSHLEKTVKLLTDLKEAQYKASLGEGVSCAPIMPSDEAGRLLLALQAPWLVQMPRGQEPLMQCKVTFSSRGDTEESCTYDTELPPCPGAIAWPDLSDALKEPFKAFNFRMAEKHEEQLLEMEQKLQIEHAEAAGALTDQAGGQASVSIWEKLTGSAFSPHVPAKTRPRATISTPYNAET